MQRRGLARITLGALALLTALAPHAARAADPAAEAAPLIPRDRLFDNPSRASARIAPDGKWIAYLAPRNGVMNVWVAPAGKLADARPLTDETAQPLQAIYWSPDSRQVLYLKDSNGDENHRLYGVNVRTGAQRSFTPFERTQVKLLATSRSVRNRVLVGVNNRDPRLHDVYSLDLDRGTLTEVFRNPGFSHFVIDDSLTIRLVARQRDDGGTDYLPFEGGRAVERVIQTVDYANTLTTRPLGYSRDGRVLYWLDSRGRDMAALLAQDAGTGTMRVLAEDARSDVVGGLFDPRTGRVQAAERYYAKREYEALDSAVAADLKFLRARELGPFSVDSRDDADRRWIVTFDSGGRPPSTWLYDRIARRIDKLYEARPELADAPLVPLHVAEIRTRDGLTMVTYYTLPASADRDGDGRADRPVPLVVMPHGGPWGRDDFSFHRTQQWLSNRGYMVIRPNFRGSTGFGKRFIDAGDHEWGRRMQDDLLDAIDWAVDGGMATRDRVGIYGPSYGGYAVLAGLAFTPDVYACGADLYGAADLVTWLEAIPSYWHLVREQYFYKRMGDPRTPAGLALLRERSPINYVQAIKRPLLIAHGTNDARVSIQESERIVEALRARDVPVTYLSFPDEGHDLSRPTNMILFRAAMENFFQSCLGGRAEPVGDALARSSAEVRANTARIPGIGPAAAQAP